MIWLVRNWLSSQVSPSFRFAYQLRGLIWLKLALRTYSLNAEAPKLIDIASPIPHPYDLRTPHASSWGGAALGPPSVHHSVPSRNAQSNPLDASLGPPIGVRSVFSTT